MVEAAYDLDAKDHDWLPAVMNAGISVLDQGLGVAGGIYTRPTNGGEVTLHQLHVASGPEDFAIRQAKVAAECPPEVQQACTRPGICITLSEAAGDRYALGLESWARHHAPSKDALGLSAVDPNGLGTLIIAPLPERTKLRGPERLRWQMIGAHLTTGYRLRRGVAALNDQPEPEPSQVMLPYQAEAVLDPKGFEVKEAVGEAKDAQAREALREAAVQVDRARGRMRTTDPEEALRIWRSMVEGKWSIVDWFDSDARRFVVAVRNAPEVGDPRGLSPRELQAATYAAFGESGKLIGYRLGLSTSGVSRVLLRVRQKLGVETHADLVQRLRVLLDIAPPPTDETVAQSSHT